MAEVDEAIGLVRLLWLPVIHGQVQVVESSFMVLLKILLDLVFGVAAWNVPDHEVGARLLSAEDLLCVNRTSIVLAHRRQEALV